MSRYQPNETNYWINLQKMPWPRVHKTNELSKIHPDNDSWFLFLGYDTTRRDLQCRYTTRFIMSRFIMSNIFVIKGAVRTVMKKTELNPANFNFNNSDLNYLCNCSVMYLTVRARTFCLSYSNCKKYCTRPLNQSSPSDFS